LNLAILILRDNAGPNLHFVTKLQNTSENTATSDTSLKLVNVGTWLVDLDSSLVLRLVALQFRAYVKGPDDHHARAFRKVTDRHGNVGNEVLCKSIDVVT